MGCGAQWGFLSRGNLRGAERPARNRQLPPQRLRGPGQGRQQWREIELWCNGNQPSVTEVSGFGASTTHTYKSNPWGTLVTRVGKQGAAQQGVVTLPARPGSNGARPAEGPVRSKLRTRRA